MYLDFYELREHPFKTNPNPRFLWFGEKHREAAAVLEYGLMKSDGFLLLTGDIGTGKTTLIRHLLGRAGQETLVASVPDPDMDPHGFFTYLADAFGLGLVPAGKAEFLIAFKRFLLKADSEGKKVFLVIDEAQSISHQLLEQIRLLSNIECDDRKLLNVFLVGQSEVAEVLAEERSQPFRQRITVSHHLEPLTAPETVHYIAHRLRVAGASRGIFTVAACHQIHRIADGIPRLINSICDCGLLTGYANGRPLIDRGIVEECESDLRISIGRQPAQGRGPDAG
jgi:general secretion pathway protein A